jgi:hypothetical protein
MDGDEEKSRFEAAAAGEPTSLIADWLSFLRQNKKLWLVPILATLLLVSGLLLLTSTAAAPFIYTLF